VTLGFFDSSNGKTLSALALANPCPWKIFGVDLGIGDIDLEG
jgi:hypothetical protein